MRIIKSMLAGICKLCVPCTFPEIPRTQFSEIHHRNVKYIQNVGCEEDPGTCAALPGLLALLCRSTPGQPVWWAAGHTRTRCTPAIQPSVRDLPSHHQFAHFPAHMRWLERVAGCGWVAALELGSWEQVQRMRRH